VESEAGQGERILTHCQFPEFGKARLGSRKTSAPSIRGIYVLVWSNDANRTILAEELTHQLADESPAMAEAAQSELNAMRPAKHGASLPYLVCSTPPHAGGNGRIRRCEEKREVHKKSGAKILRVRIRYRPRRGRIVLLMLGRLRLFGAQRALRMQEICREGNTLPCRLHRNPDSFRPIIGDDPARNGQARRRPSESTRGHPSAGAKDSNISRRFGGIRFQCPIR